MPQKAKRHNQLVKKHYNVPQLVQLNKAITIREAKKTPDGQLCILSRDRNISSFLVGNCPTIVEHQRIMSLSQFNNI